MQNRIQKSAAIIIGSSLIIMAIAAGIAIGSFQTKLWIKEDAEATAANWSTALFLGLLACWITIVLTDTLVSWAVYVYYKNKAQTLAMISSALRWIYTFLLAVAVYQLIGLYNLHTEADQALAIWELFDNNWAFALIIFGLHLLFWGYLSWKDARAPKWLSFTLMLAGIAYFVIHLIKYFFPQQIAVINGLVTIFMLPMIVGELGMGIWLVGWGWRSAAQ